MSVELYQKLQEVLGVPDNCKKILIEFDPDCLPVVTCEYYVISGDDGVVE